MIQPQPTPTRVNTRPVDAAPGVYIAPSPLIATYPAWMLRRNRPRRTA